mgnify:CR=1 FL=1
MPYMGYEDLKFSTRLSVDEVARLAKEHGLDYDFTDKGIRLIDPSDGSSRSFGSNPKARTIGNYLGYSKGGKVKRSVDGAATRGLTRAATKGFGKIG